VDTGGWLSGRRVLICPEAMGEPNWIKRVIPVSLTKQQVEESPGVDSDKPVSRQEEQALAEYYAWPAYWGPVAVPAVGAMPPAAVVAKPPEAEEAPAEPLGDPKLRSIKEVLGYHIHAADGQIGHVEDFIADTSSWVLRYLVVDTRNWLPGKKVLIAPPWIDRISWADRRVHVCLDRRAVEGAPMFHPEAPINREYEVLLYDYYGVPRYWERAKQ
jgi:hypothetical protein